MQHINQDSSDFTIKLPLSVWTLLEIQRLRFIEEALTGAPFMQEQQQGSYEVLEKLEVPGIPDPIRGWEGQDLVVANFSRADSGDYNVSKGHK